MQLGSHKSSLWRNGVTSRDMEPDVSSVAWGSGVIQRSRRRWGVRLWWYVSRRRWHWSGVPVIKFVAHEEGGLNSNQTNMNINTTLLNDDRFCITSNDRIRPSMRWLKRSTYSIVLKENANSWTDFDAHTLL